MAYEAIDDFILDQVFGYQSANELKNNIEALVASRFTASLGGSREVGVQHNAVSNAYEYRDDEIDSTKLSGLTVRARVECRTDDAGTSITPEIYRVTDTTVHVTGTAETSTSFVEQLLTMTPLTAGTKKYRLRGTPSNNTNPVYFLGVRETYA